MDAPHDCDAPQTITEFNAHVLALMDPLIVASLLAADQFLVDMGWTNLPPIEDGDWVVVEHED
jgi:hypothetical protein